MLCPLKKRLREIDPEIIRFEKLQTLQVNLGNLCNMCCAHCHVGASPSGDHIMGPQIIDEIAAALRRLPGLILDITGGCPEMSPHFRRLIEATEGLSPRRIVRCNLTILTEPGYDWLPDFFRRHKLVITASLPCYLEENVDRQRGRGTHNRSLEALRRLNAVGYGDTLELNLVYNPEGDTLPGSQQQLETAYRQRLQDQYGIRFHRLFTLANMPIGRFRELLERQGTYQRYMTLLADNFNPDTARSIMCRTLVSVDWQGILYNCDFNQALGIPMRGAGGEILRIDALDATLIEGRELQLDQHCYCCTAGEGSSCTGALVA